MKDLFDLIQSTHISMPSSNFDYGLNTRESYQPQIGHPAYGYANRPEYQSPQMERAFTKNGPEPITNKAKLSAKKKKEQLRKYAEEERLLRRRVQNCELSEKFQRLHSIINDQTDYKLFIQKLAEIRAEYSRTGVFKSRFMKYYKFYLLYCWHKDPTTKDLRLLGSSEALSSTLADYSMSHLMEMLASLKSLTERKQYKHVLKEVDAIYNKYWVMIKCHDKLFKAYNDIVNVCESGLGDY